MTLHFVFTSLWVLSSSRLLCVTDSGPSVLTDKHKVSEMNIDGCHNNISSAHHTAVNCSWYLGVDKNQATDPLTDQAGLDWLRMIPWNSRIGRRPIAHFLCVWEELQPPGLKCISWLCIKVLLMTRSASAATPVRPNSFAHSKARQGRDRRRRETVAQGHNVVQPPRREDQGVEETNDGPS